MAKEREVTNEQFLEIKSKVGQAESAVKRVPISAISVDNETLRKGRILVNGQPVRVSNSFFSKLGSMLRISTTLTRQMIEKGDTKIAAALINGLKDYTVKNKRDNDVMLIANVNTKEIVDICTPARYKRVTNDTLFDVTERILNDNSSLILETVDFNPNTGKASINFLNQDEIGFAQAGKDEFFKFGFSIIQTNKDTIVESYNQRLICSNGLRTSLGSGAIGGNSNQGMNFEDKFRLGGTSTEDIRIFLNKIEDMKKAQFVPGTFEGAINRAVGTKASYLEVEKAWKAANAKVDEINPDIKKQYQAALARDFFHAYGNTANRIKNKGADPFSLNEKQKSFIKTDMSIWDVVNSMTFLGSNNSGFELSNKHELKYSAGELFAKGAKEGYDLEFAQYANL
jgi:hypothetical protein